MDREVGWMEHEEVGQMDREEVRLEMEDFVNPGAGRIAETNG